MNVTTEYAWSGNAREPVIVIRENGVRVASFDDENEAHAWCVAEYGEDIANNLEIL